MHMQSKNTLIDTESFRDHLGIITDDGKRRNIYPKKPKGKFYNARNFSSIALLAFLFGMPLIKVEGHSFMMLNIIERKFILFGQVFGTHDFFILALGFITFIVFIILFTALFGRVFCGWACPQTVFLEMVFRKIEFFIEGDYIRQKNLNESPWTGSKIFKKLFKWSIFFALSVLIANTFIAWVVGIDELKNIIVNPVSKHLGGFIAMMLFSGAFYFVFAYFREYACIYVCPYGRLQGVLLDKSSTVIAYDYVRGEPRGKIYKGEQRTNGDCIDCKECMAVCPTAIDIRNGTQLECVNCTACIDACDNIMDKIDKPRGLIRFASESNIKNQTKFKITARVIAYSAVLIILLTVLTILIFNRKPIDVTILRAPGMIFQEQPDNKISNLYTMKLTNKTFRDIPVTMKLENIDGEIKVIGKDIKVGSNDVSETKFLVLLLKENLKTMNTQLEIGLYSNDERFELRNINFLGPAVQK